MARRLTERQQRVQDRAALARLVRQFRAAARVGDCKRMFDAAGDYDRIRFKEHNMPSTSKRYRGITKYAMDRYIERGLKPCYVQR